MTLLTDGDSGSMALREILLWPARIVLKEEMLWMAGMSTARPYQDSCPATEKALEPKDMLPKMAPTHRYSDKELFCPIKLIHPKLPCADSFGYS